MKRVIDIKNGKRIILRHLKKTDKDGVWKNFNEVLEEGIYLPVFTPVISEIEKDSWYENIKREKELCIVAEIPDLKTPFNLIGQCEISNLEWEAGAHVARLGIIVAKKYRDMGVGFNLIDVAIRESKKLNNKEKIILTCFSTNDRAIHLYKKLGFQVVGVRKKQFYMNSTYYDEIMFEIWIDDYLANT
jgi:RimJ/RimL family protein N-acetyltransferase